jgi:hypothetical protein
MPASGFVANEPSISTFVNRPNHLSNAANSWLVPGTALQLNESVYSRMVGNPEVGNSERDRCSLFANW